MGEMNKQSYQFPQLLFTSQTRLIFFLAAFATVVTACSKNNAENPNAYQPRSENGVVYLGQGWEQAERQKLSYTSFGSRILDYDWFMALEQTDNENLFRENTHMLALGFITETASAFNPDGLPVGVTRDSDKDGRTWVGLTCAACHTGEVIVNNQPIRIDGGQSLLNYSDFENRLLATLILTLEQPEKWQRFLERLRNRQKSLDESTLKKNVQMRISELKNRYEMNATDVAYGHGRLDAFGQIFNAIAVEALHISENRRSPNAPTSYPVLWDASHLDLVQWNASAPNSGPGPLAQNATTALAVYGKVEVLGRNSTYPSSIAIKNLGYIQRQFYKLVAPPWPEFMLGPINTQLHSDGEKIYRQHCLQCHELVDSNNPKRQLSAVLVPASEVGTDELMVNNFSDGTVKTGELQGKHFALWFGEKFGGEATRLDIVMHVTLGALIHNTFDSLYAAIAGYAKNKTSDVNASIKYYKARPINGIWASAPYLHNGSVPSVYDLLLPVAQRPTEFYVGNRELDIVNLGNKTTKTLGASLFNTGLLGNSNKGHEYGTDLKEEERMALLEYIKRL